MRPLINREESQIYRFVLSHADRQEHRVRRANHLMACILEHRGQLESGKGLTGNNKDPHLGPTM
jgi:hypothetical protein